MLHKPQYKADFTLIQVACEPLELFLTWRWKWCIKCVFPQCFLWLDFSFNYQDVLLMHDSNAHQFSVTDWWEGETIDFAGLQVYTSSILQLWEFIVYTIFYFFFLSHLGLFGWKKAGELQCVNIWQNRDKSQYLMEIQFSFFSLQWSHICTFALLWLY